jgi:hypothetical protein
MKLQYYNRKLLDLVLYLMMMARKFGNDILLLSFVEIRNYSIMIIFLRPCDEITDIRQIDFFFKSIII